MVLFREADSPDSVGKILPPEMQDYAVYLVSKVPFAVSARAEISQGARRDGTTLRRDRKCRRVLGLIVPSDSAPTLYSE